MNKDGVATRALLGPPDVELLRKLLERWEGRPTTTRSAEAFLEALPRYGFTLVQAAEHAPPDTPWYWSRSADGGTMAYFKRVTDNWNFAGHLTDTEANAVRDALNAAANGAPLTAQISKLVGDINNVFAPRIRELLAENDVLRGSRPALAGSPAQKAIDEALSVDGVNEDDAPERFGDVAASAWVCGYEAGQESVQSVLRGLNQETTK